MNKEFLEIVRKFQKTGVPFAITGSWAIKLHAEKIGLNPHRTPQDFDFAVENFEPFVNALSDLGYKLDGFPRLGVKPKKMTMKKWPYEVDLLRAGGPLAPSLDNIVNYGKMPLVSVKSMMNKKRNILNTIKNKKALQNLNFLTVLENFRKPPSPVKRSFGLERIGTRF